MAEEIVKLEVFRTRDGKTFEDRGAAELHVRELAWMRFCAENSIVNCDADLLWLERARVVELLREP